MEGDSRELATVSRRADSAPARTYGGGNRNSPSPRHNPVKPRVEEVEGIQVERWTGFGGRGATVSLHEHRAGCGGNGASVFRLGEPGQSEREEEGE
jgi:hypothetical protein